MMCSWCSSVILVLGCVVDGLIFEISNTTNLCYSCLSTYPSYVGFRDTALKKYLQQKKITVPGSSRECVEAESWEQLNFSQVAKFLCESGVCVKVKGEFEEEPFVLRECWERMWDKEIQEHQRPVKGVDTCEPLDLLWEAVADICTCTGDLCNSSAHTFLCPVTLLCTLAFIMLKDTTWNM